MASVKIEVGQHRFEARDLFFDGTAFLAADAFLEPLGEDVDVLADGQTLTFRATALNPGGLSGVGVAVEDPTGRVLLVSSTIAVRSTAFPVVALVATIGAALFLAVWGLRQTRRRRVPGAGSADERVDEQVDGQADDQDGHGGLREVGG